MGPYQNEWDIRLSQRTHSAFPFHVVAFPLNSEWQKSKSKREMKSFQKLFSDFKSQVHCNLTFEPLNGRLGKFHIRKIKSIFTRILPCCTYETVSEQEATKLAHFGVAREAETEFWMLLTVDAFCRLTESQMSVSYWTGARRDCALLSMMTWSRPSARAT
jgi:hypothetical protein